MNASDFPRLLDRYRATLLDDVIPFWERHAFDANGGINTCIADDGTIISRDRWNWSQWRAVWVWSRLYNQVERRAEWLDRALGIYRFITAHGPLQDNHWPLLLDGDGKLLRGYDSLYVDAFAIYALAELYRATRDAEVLALVRQTFAAACSALESPDPPPAYPYPIPPGRIVHGMSMIFSLAFFELADVLDDAEIRAAAYAQHRRVMDIFLRKDRDVVLEFVGTHGEELAPPQGTAIVPGHAIESMWFQIHIARAAGDRITCRRAAQVIRRHLELGWDAEFGGMFLAVDADRRAEVGWAHADTKLWWPHTEALYATLLAYEETGESWCLDWHQRVHDFSYAHYPVPAHGEWRQKLDRHARPITQTLVLPVKDPFHLPRALMLCMEVLERMIAPK